jgi:hypothetical protein
MDTSQFTEDDWKDLEEQLLKIYKDRPMEDGQWNLNASETSELN